ncbi:hypothetical protein AB6A40_007890 [Gnathostoma spinigerum]|uniref:Uncharacterized protein n=1 Tax=Gnathostoma spinigerum TaxID=75299 RepID=A0ABD6EPI1_9BILA
MPATMKRQSDTALLLICFLLISMQMVIAERDVIDGNADITGYGRSVSNEQTQSILIENSSSTTQQTISSTPISIFTTSSLHRPVFGFKLPLPPVERDAISKGRCTFGKVYKPIF